MRIFILAILTAIASHAGAASYCPFPVSSLITLTTSCFDNEIYFGSAAVSCVENFKKDLQATTGKIKLNLETQSENALQKGSLEKAEADYKMVNENLKRLLLDGKNARNLVSIYLKELVLPEDFDTKPELIKSASCYVENEELLIDILKDFDAKLEKLEFTQIGMEQRAKLSEVKKSAMASQEEILHINSTEEEQVTGNNRKASDISGEEKLKSTP